LWPETDAGVLDLARRWRLGDGARHRRRRLDDSDVSATASLLAPVEIGKPAMTACRLHKTPDDGHASVWWMNGRASRRAGSRGSA
jgi:hypothetical protein